MIVRVRDYGPEEGMRERVFDVSGDDAEVTVEAVLSNDKGRAKMSHEFRVVKGVAVRIEKESAK